MGVYMYVKHLAHKQDISKREGWMDVKVCMWMPLIEVKKPIVYSGSHRSFGIHRDKNKS